jgi:hypothetical protein
MRTTKRRLSTVVITLAALVASAGFAQDQNQDAPGGPTPPRLAAIDGEVSFWRPGADDWTPAHTNTPLAAGDSLYTADGGSADVQIGADAAVRLGSATELGIDSLETNYLQLKLSSGRAGLDLARLDPGQTIEVDTPSAAFTIDKPGYYRLDVDGETTNFITRRGGSATLLPAGGQSTEVAPDQLVVVTGSETANVAAQAAPPPDQWDQASLGRPSAPAASESRRYVPPDVAGADDLDHYGTWRETQSYGHVWVPNQAPADWAPYSAGRWIYDPYYGWTWVDDAPWGWAPYHYGRWVYADSYWGWAPGPIVSTAVYAPALVTFFGFGAPGIGVSVGVGLPFVSWVALGWGEPLIPWWGHSGFYGHCWWGGWHGPHVVNNVVIDRRTFVDVHRVNTFQNTRVRNGVIAVDRNRFGRGGAVEHRRLGEEEVRHLQPMRGGLGVRPAAGSLAPNQGRGRRPPEQVLNRRVVATRQPEDVRPRLHAAGLDERRAAPSPHLVRQDNQAPARRQAQGPTGMQAPPPHAAGHRPNAEMNTRRTTPPPPSGQARHGAPQQDYGKPRSSGQPPRAQGPSHGAPHTRASNPPEHHRTVDVPRTSRQSSPSYDREVQPPPHVRSPSPSTYASQPHAAPKQHAAPPQHSHAGPPAHGAPPPQHATSPQQHGAPAPPHGAPQGQAHHAHGDHESAH